MGDKELSLVFLWERLSSRDEAFNSNRMIAAGKPLPLADNDPIKVLMSWLKVIKPVQAIKMENRI